MRLLLVQEHTLGTTDRAHIEDTTEEYQGILIPNKALSPLEPCEESSAGSNLLYSLRKSFLLFGFQCSLETLSYYRKKLTS